MKNYKKGISPLLASVLLIAFTVALATIIFGFMQSTVRSTTVTTQNRTTEATDCAAASIKIEDVYVVTANNGTVYAVVRNAGITDNLVLTNAQVFNSSGVAVNATGFPLSDFDKGEVARITFSTPQTLGNMYSAGCPSAFSKVIVTTNCAGISDTFDQTPKCAAS